MGTGYYLWPISNLGPVGPDNKREKLKTYTDACCCLS